MEKKKVNSVKEALADQNVKVEVVKAYGHFKLKDKLIMHKTTAAVLIKKELVKKS